MTQQSFKTHSWATHLNEKRTRQDQTSRRGAKTSAYKSIKVLTHSSNSCHSFRTLPEYYRSVVAVWIFQQAHRHWRVHKGTGLCMQRAIRVSSALPRLTLIKAQTVDFLAQIWACTHPFIRTLFFFSFLSLLDCTPTLLLPYALSFPHPTRCHAALLNIYHYTQILSQHRSFFGWPVTFLRSQQSDFRFAPCRLKKKDSPPPPPLVPLSKAAGELVIHNVTCGSWGLCEREW